MKIRDARKTSACGCCLSANWEAGEYLDNGFFIKYRGTLLQCLWWRLKTWLSGERL